MQGREGREEYHKKSKSKSKPAIVAAMNSVGIFRKVQIEEKPFLEFTLTHTHDNTTSSGEALAIDSGGDDLPLEPLFLCPAAHIKFEKLKLKEEEVEFRPFSDSSHFPSTRNGDHQQSGESLLDCNRFGECKLPVVPLFWCNNKEPDHEDFECGACETSTLSRSYFACLQCQKKFHKECVVSPLEIKHPSHPLHSLQLYSSNDLKLCFGCKSPTREIYYSCRTCDYNLHPTCAMKPIPFAVDHPKSHPHPLTFFPAQASLVCSFCATIKKLDPTYICIECVFAIHADCIGFPHVIRISRHRHRISFTSSLPLGKLSCGVCRLQVDNNYGAYSCSKCEAYFVHSKCAINRKVWDGKELEGISEEDDVIDDGEPFQRIADGIILHPFHSHNLRFEEINRANYDAKRYCRGCALPIYEGQFYSCMECEFILHESCAKAPRMIRHPLYPHPLTLKVATTRHSIDTDESTYLCKACSRDGNGFFYEYHKGRNRYRFQLDLRCASVVEPFEYQDHKHPLFLAWDFWKQTRCRMCRYESADSKLICTECDYTICFRCATFPYKARYKHDNHFLTICDGKEANDQPDWCEVCEREIEEVKAKRYLYTGFGKERELRFYKCNDCCTTVHVECLFGMDMYMKPTETEELELCFTRYRFPGKEKTWVYARAHLNGSLSRPCCTKCRRRCPFQIYFKGMGNTIFCSVHCLKASRDRLRFLL